MIKSSKVTKCTVESVFKRVFQLIPAICACRLPRLCARSSELSAEGLGTICQVVEGVECVLFLLDWLIVFALEWIAKHCGERIGADLARPKLRLCDRLCKLYLTELCLACRLSKLSLACWISELGLTWLTEGLGKGRRLGKSRLGGLERTGQLDWLHGTCRFGLCSLNVFEERVK